MKGLGRLFFTGICVFIKISCTNYAPEQRPKLQNPAFDRKLIRLMRFSIPLIGTEELYKIQSEVYIFDTREWEEFEVSHLKGAYYLGYKNFNEKRLRQIPQDSKIVVYCSVGYRSEKIGEKIRALGYTEVYNLYGSIFEWVNAGYEVVDQYNKPVRKVHTYNRTWSKWLQNKNMKKTW